MIKQLYIIPIILIMTISFYSCEDFGVEPNEGNLTYKIIGNSPVSNEEGLFITRLNDDYILGGITNVASTKDYMLAKADKNGKVSLNFHAGFPLTDDALMQVIVTDEASSELFVLLNQESEQSFKLTPSLAKVTYATPDSNTTIDNSIFLERDNLVNENDVIREVTVKALYLESSDQFLVLSNIIEKYNEKIRITLVDHSGNKTWSRIYSFDNGTATPPSLEGIGITQKSTGNFTVMGNMTTENATTGDDDVKIFVLEIDDLGNEVNVKFPIQNEFLLDFTNITMDDYALITTKIDGNDIFFKDLNTYKYNTTSFSLANGKTFSTNGNDNTLVGKSVQKIGQNIIITAIESEIELNTALIYKLDLDLDLVWKKEYYYSETSINRLDIGNAIERIGGGYAVIGTHDLKSSTKIVLLLLDEDGNYIDN